MKQEKIILVAGHPVCFTLREYASRQTTNGYPLLPESGRKFHPLAKESPCAAVVRRGLQLCFLHSLFVHIGQHKHFPRFRSPEQQQEKVHLFPANSLGYILELINNNLIIVSILRLRTPQFSIYFKRIKYYRNPGSKSYSRK